MTPHKKALEESTPAPVPETDAEEATRLVHAAEAAVEPVLDKVVEEVVHLVHMVRDAAHFPNPPHTATIHPTNVDEMLQNGWRVAD